MPYTALITLGRLPKALAIARSLKSLGCRVIVAEPFKWHLSRPSRAIDRCATVPPPNIEPAAYQRALLDLIAEEHVDLVIPVSEEIHHVAGIADQLPDHVRILGPDQSTLATLQNKLTFARRLAESGTPGPESHAADSAEAAALATRQDYVLKPGLGCSGINVSEHRAGETIHNPSPDMLVQSRIEGEHYSSLTWLDKGEERGTVVYQGTVFSGTVAVCFERTDGLVAIHDWISQFVEHLDFTGFVAFDFILDAQGKPWPIECNPRLTSGIHFFDEHGLAEALLGVGNAQWLPLNQKRRYQWGYSTLTEAYSALFSGRGKEFLRRMGQLFTARDVVWRSSDPLPFILMTPMSWSILKPTLLSGISLGEASQRDIAALWSPLPRLNGFEAGREG